MSGMKWEHRNRMDKVRSYPPAPARKRSKKKKAKSTKPYPTQLKNAHGHVQMKSKYNSKCGACTKGINVGNLIWWNPDDKYVIHDQCFDKYFQ